MKVLIGSIVVGVCIGAGMIAANAAQPVVPMETVSERARNIAQEIGVDQYIGIGKDLRVMSTDGGYELTGDGEWGGAIHPEGDPLHEGIWFFKADTVLLNPIDAAHIFLENDAILYVMPQQLADSCSVTCGVGYYACCADPDGLPLCKCVSNNTDPNGECDSGGPGAVTCSLNNPAPIDPKDLDDGGDPGRRNVAR